MDVIEWIDFCAILSFASDRSCWSLVGVLTVIYYACVAWNPAKSSSCSLGATLVARLWSWKFTMKATRSDLSAMLWLLVLIATPWKSQNPWAKRKSSSDLVWNLSSNSSTTITSCPLVTLSTLISEATSMLPLSRSLNHELKHERKSRKFSKTGQDCMRIISYSFSLWICYVFGWSFAAPVLHF